MMRSMPTLLPEFFSRGFLQSTGIAGWVALALSCALGCSDGEASKETSSGGSTSGGGTGGTTGGTSGSGGFGAAGSSGTDAGGANGTGGASVGGASAGSGVTGGATSAGATSGGSPATGGTSGATATGGASGAGGSSGAAGAAGVPGGSGGSGGSSGAPLLDQTGNFIYDQLETYKSWRSTASGDAAKLSADRALANNMLTWQLPHGGFYKNGVAAYGAAWNGSAARSGWTGANGVELGTIDNDATVTEIMFLADVYARSGTTTYRDGARRALDFILTMQYPSGGFPQVYPARTGATYSNEVTFNDDAMARALVLLLEVTRQVAPLAGDLFTADQRTRAATAITKGVGYILAAQIAQGGVKTVWCAQHDPTSYVPLGARSYELASKSGSESVGIIGFLMTQPQTPELAAAVHAAIAWFKNPAVAKVNTAYVSRPSSSTDDNYNPIQSRSGSTMWCRFYDVTQDRCFFSGRLPTDDPPGNGKQYDIMLIEPERRYGYQWGGAYGTRLFAYTDSVGY
jgi:PelA/Pel-15E family pectate lyase